VKRGGQEMPILEKRMIYRVGKSSLAITLPQNWLKYFGLTAGDTVEITGNGDLTIRPHKGQGKGIERLKDTYLG
jgi:antitoxin component of MazEF toxin-antitoxin module